MPPSARRVLVIFPRRGKDQPEVSELIETTPAAWRYTTMLAASTQDYRRKSGDVDRGEPRAFHSLCDESLGATRAEHSFNNAPLPESTSRTPPASHSGSIMSGVERMKGRRTLLECLKFQAP